MQCPALAPIPNGAITYRPDTIDPFDVFAIHSCNPGFRLLGSETRICSQSGSWFGQPPVCERKTVLYVRTMHRHA